MKKSVLVFHKKTKLRTDQQQKGGIFVIALLMFF